MQVAALAAVFPFLSSSTLMPEFTTVAKVGSIPEKQGQSFVVGGRTVAVFREADQYFAIDDFCPHMGASLAGGPVEDGAVMCPWHAWCFSIKDGTWLNNKKLKVDAFEVRIVGDEIQVCVPEKK